MSAQVSTDTLSDGLLLASSDVVSVGLVPVSDVPELFCMMPVLPLLPLSLSKAYDFLDWSFTVDSYEYIADEDERYRPEYQPSEPYQLEADVHGQQSEQRMYAIC